MCKWVIFYISLACVAIFGNRPIAAEDLSSGKEVAGINWSVNFGFYGCPSPCYGPCYFDPWYGYPYSCGPYYVPYPGPYRYGCRPCPPYWAW